MPPPAPTRVLIVDDHDLVREGLRFVLENEPELEVVGEAGSGEGAIELLERVQPDLVLMDVRMPGIGGIEATRRIHQMHPHVRVLVVSAFPDYVLEALEAGAVGYLVKTGGSRRLIAALRSALLGTTVVESDLLGNAVFERAARRAQNSGPLTEREIDVLRLVARGLTNRAIARQIGVAPRTADQHVHNIFVKVGVTSRTAAVRYAIEHDLVSTT